MTPKTVKESVAGIDIGDVIRGEVSDDKYLPCDGRLISVTDPNYLSLYRTIGFSYGGSVDNRLTIFSTPIEVLEHDGIVYVVTTSYIWLSTGEKYSFPYTIESGFVVTVNNNVYVVTMTDNNTSGGIIRKSIRLYYARSGQLIGEYSLTFNKNYGQSIRAGGIFINYIYVENAIYFACQIRTYYGTSTSVYYSALVKVDLTGNASILFQGDNNNASSGHFSGGVGPYVLRRNPTNNVEGYWYDIRTGITTSPPFSDLLPAKMSSGSMCSFPDENIAISNYNNETWIINYKNMNNVKVTKICWDENKSAVSYYHNGRIYLALYVGSSLVDNTQIFYAIIPLDSDFLDSKYVLIKDVAVKYVVPSDCKLILQSTNSSDHWTLFRNLKKHYYSDNAIYSSAKFAIPFRPGYKIRVK